MPGPRDESLAGRDLGDIIYCIGLTADQRAPVDTVDVHVMRSAVNECGNGVWRGKSHPGRVSHHADRATDRG